MVRKAETSFSALIALLSRMDADELAALLTARPDAATVPEPRTISELAMRLGNEHSVPAALAQLSLPQMRLAETLRALGDGCPRTELDRLLGVGDTLDPAMLDQLLTGLHRLALAWPDGPVLRIAPGTDQLSTDPLALGAPAAALLEQLTVEQLTQIAASHGIRGQRRKSEWVSALGEVLADPVRLDAALHAAPSGVGEIIEQLIWRNPRVPGPVQFALHGTHSYGLPLTVMWLTQHGFLLPSGWDAGQMPREVALALRGADYHPILGTDQPALHTAQAGTPAAPHVSIVDGVRRMLGVLGISPGQQLAAGGVGVRELRRLMKELTAAEGEVRLWLELAAAMGLLRPDGNGEILPTRSADAWLAEPPGRQLIDLVTAWQTVGPVPTHRVGSEDKALPALGPDDTTQIGRTLRADLLRLLTEYPEGTAVTDLDSLVDLIAWRHPLRYHSAEALSPYLLATWTEAQHLGLVADAALSTLGWAVATGAGQHELVELAGQIVPAPVARATFLPDLSAVVSGPPSAELAGLLDLVAELEGRDTASTWRFSPDSVRRALDAGHTADGLLAQLGKVADRPLPQPVEYLIKDAARRHGRLQVRQVSCAVCTDDETLAAEIAAHRKLAGLELSLLSATVLGSAKPANETLRLLRIVGYSPVQQCRTGQTLVERVAPRRAPDLPRTQQPARPEPVAPAVLAARLVGGNVVELPVIACEQEVKANASALDDAQARLLAYAIEHQSPVRIDYVSASGGYTRRIIRPIALFFDAIRAWCQLRGGERVFRLDRICAVGPA